MIKQPSYLHFIRISIFLVLLGLSLDNIVSYAFPDVAHCDFELFDPFDTDGENESKNEKDKEDKEDEKIEVNSFAIDTESNQSLINSLLSLSLTSNPHPDINTPPPKQR